MTSGSPFESLETSSRSSAETIGIENKTSVGVPLSLLGSGRVPLFMLGPKRRLG